MSIIFSLRTENLSQTVENVTENGGYFLCCVYRPTFLKLFTDKNERNLQELKCYNISCTSKNFFLVSFVILSFFIDFMHEK